MGSTMGFSLVSIKKDEIKETFSNIQSETPCWIFAAKNALSNSALQDLEKQLTEFSDEWAHHGNSLELGVIGVDEQVFVLYTQQSVGGCSRDALLKQLQSLQGNVNVEWVEPGSFGFYIDEELKWSKLPEIKIMSSEKKINAQSDVCQLHLHQIGQIHEEHLFTQVSLSQLKRIVK
jgi:hypothetical protein